MRCYHLRMARVLLATILVVAPSAASAGEVGEATLKNLVVQAIETHEMVEVANSEVRRAQADVKLARSALMPRFEVNGSYTFYDDDLSIELSPGEAFVIRPSQDWTASVDLRQNLFTGLRAWRASDRAKRNRDIAELDRSTTVNELTLEVAAAFYSAVSLAEWVDVREIVLEENENQLKVAERLFEVGENSVADVARWRAQVASAKQALTVAVGDAVGTTLEFKQPGTFEPIDDMVGGGPFLSVDGLWKDVGADGTASDAAGALALADELLSAQPG